MEFKILLNIDDKSHDNRQRNKFYAKIFGIFNEEIIRIWCARENSIYKDLGRPTLYVDNKKRGSTLDFTLLDKQTNKSYVSEMKCWLENNNYKFLVFTNKTNLSSYIKESKAFKLFMEYAKKKNRDSIKVKVGEGKNRKVIKCAGSILVWPSFKSEDKEAILDKFNLSDIISLESVINDLIEEKNQEYFDLLKEKKNWVDNFISGLSGNVL